MGAALLGKSHILDPVTGTFVSGKVQQIAELINDYNHNLYLVWIPENERKLDGPKPFGIAHFLEGREPYMVMLCDESELDERLLAKLWAMDQGVHDVNDYLDKVEAAAEAMKLKKQLDEREEAHDIVAHVLKSPLNTYRVNKNQVYRA